MPHIPLPLFTETLEELRQRLQAERKRRLHMLLLFKEDPTRTREAVAQHLAVHRNTIGRWLRRYARGGLEALLSIERRGPKPGQRTVPRPVYVAIQKRLRQPEGFADYKALQQMNL